VRDRPLIGPPSSRLNPVELSPFLVRSRSRRPRCARRDAKDQSATKPSVKEGSVPVQLRKN
jgi:hypothetical protein